MFSASAACSAQNSQTIARDRRRMNVHKHSRRPFSPAGCCRFPRPVVCSSPLAPTTTFVLVRAPQIKDRCARDSSKMYQADCFFLLFFSLSLSPQSLSNPTPRALLLLQRLLPGFAVSSSRSVCGLKVVVPEIAVPTQRS